MFVLALDTSTDRSVLALSGPHGELVQAAMIAGRQHGRELIPQLRALLASAGVATADLGAIAVGLGPGSYTGTRVGVTAAKTLAYATGATLIGLDSLHVIAQNAPPDATRVAVIADAQRNEVYVAEFARSPGEPLRTDGPTRIEPLSAWVGRLEPGTLVLGPALDSPRIRPLIPPDRRADDDERNAPRAAPMIAIAREAIAAGRCDNPWLLEPMYLRRSAAEDQWDARKAAAPR